MNNRILLGAALGILAIGIFLVGCEKEQDPGIVGLDALSELSLWGVNGEAGVYSTDLFAGQSIYAGTVSLEVLGDNLCLTVVTEGGWELEEVHVWVGESLSDMPATRKGNPIPGQFPYSSGDITGETTYQICADLTEFGGEEGLCGSELLTAVHTALRKDNGDGTYQTETGWGDGDRMVDKGNWAEYFSVQFSCGEAPPGSGAETAWAYGCDDATCFTDIDAGNGEGLFERWGWSNGPIGEGTYYFDLYAGAGQCDLEKGTLVGQVVVVYSGTTATVTYTTGCSYTMSETHLFVGNEPLARNNQNDYTVAPGQFPHKHEGLTGSTDEYVVENLSGDIYVVAHAVVNGNFEEGDCDEFERGCVSTEPCAKEITTVYTTEYVLPDGGGLSGAVAGTIVDDWSGGRLNPWCNNVSSPAGYFCKGNGNAANETDGDPQDCQRNYIWDPDDTFGTVDFDTYRMLVFDLGTPKHGLRLYTAIDHWNGDPNQFKDNYFVSQDVMEYSVWGLVDESDPTNMASWVLLSDVVGMDYDAATIDANGGHATYYYDGVSGPAAAAPTKVYTQGSSECGLTNGYTREYVFCDAYRFIGVRSSTISKLDATTSYNGVLGDADPELDAVYGFDPAE